MKADDSARFEEDKAVIYNGFEVRSICSRYYELSSVRLVPGVRTSGQDRGWHKLCSLQGSLYPRPTSQPTCCIEEGKELEVRDPQAVTWLTC
jgi:hypothetical protein